MKKIFFSLCLSIIFLSCDGPNFKLVESEILKNEEGAKDKALSQLLDLYSKSDKSKSNYELYNINIRFGLNYNPSKKLLFLATDLCEWISVYKNVDEDKMKSAVASKIKVEEYDKFFEIDKDAYKSKQEFLMTNSCRGGKVPF